MRACLYAIVEVEEDYNNTTKLSNGLEIYVNNSIDDVEHINRQGKVIGVPQGFTIKEGDMIMFHHNICRRSWGLKGKKRESIFLIKDNIYYIPSTEIYMVKSPNDSDWRALDPHTFISAIKAKKYKLPNGLEVEEDSYKEMKDLVGIMEYPNKELIKQGVKRGDTVAFEEYSQHEYVIDGKLYYRMKTQDILAIYERSE